MSIIELITIPFFNLVLWMISIFPQISLPMDFFAAADTFGVLVSSFGYLVPLSTASAVMILYLAYTFLKFVFYGATYFIHYIPIIRPNR